MYVEFENVIWTEKISSEISLYLSLLIIIV
jgi:hypothetical protein